MHTWYLLLHHLQMNPASRGTAIRRLFIAKHKATGECKGYAFVTFDLISDAERALDGLNKKRFMHSVLQVEWSEAKVRNNVHLSLVMKQCCAQKPV